jgi:signal transduction histidine kinase
MKSSVKEIAKGDFNVRIREDARCDELGELARSITQMKDELKEKDRLKDEFINIASHELRTPIQPILSYVELAKRGVVDKEKSFDIVIEQARRLKRLADDILDVSRIEGKRLVLNKEYFMIDDVLKSILDEKRPTLSKDVAIELNASGEKIAKPIQLYADKSRITQVLSNIIGNAMKFTKKGSINISTTLIDSGSAAEISIIDTGGGIPDEIFPKLFSKFATRSVENGTEHGTGLGLFICKGIVEAHGGTIAGLNNDHGGATFKIILPVEKPEVIEEVRQPEPVGQVSERTMNMMQEKASVIVR